MKHLIAVLTIVLSLLAMDARAQLYNGMPQPETFRSVHAWTFPDAGDTFTGGFFMGRAINGNHYKLFGGAGYNTSGDLSIQVWNSFNLLRSHLWILPMTKFSTASEEFSIDLATTLHIDKNKMFRINTHVFDIQDGEIDRKQATLGVRPIKRIAFNAGASHAQDTEFVANARLWLYKNNWIEYRYMKDSFRLLLFFHFN